MQFLRALAVVMLLTIASLATCPPTNVTCAEDGQAMWMTGRTKSAANGYMEYEFTHTYLAQGGKVGEVGHHYAW